MGKYQKDELGAASVTLDRQVFAPLLKRPECLQTFQNQVLAR